MVSVPGPSLEPGTQQLLLIDMKLLSAQLAGRKSRACSQLPRLLQNLHLSAGLTWIFPH